MVLVLWFISWFVLVEKICLVSGQDLCRVLKIHFGLVGYVDRVAGTVVINTILSANPNMQGLDLTNLFSEQTLKKTFKYYLNQLWGSMQDFGVFCSGVVGFYMAIYIAVIIFNSILRGIAIKKAIGWSFKLLAALMHYPTDIILQQTEQELKQKKKEKKLKSIMNNLNNNTPSFEIEPEQVEVITQNSSAIFSNSKYNWLSSLAPLIHSRSQRQ